MKKITKLVFVGLLTGLLTGCSFFDTSSSNNASNEEIDSNINSNDQESLKGISGEEYFTYKGEGYSSMLPSKGSPSCIVAPIMFKGETLANSDKVLSDINIAFNGLSNETSFESVDSFYQKSSYNQLDIDFTVVDKWITLDKTLDEMIAYASGAGIDADASWYAVDYVAKYLRRSGYNMQDYDSNGDGYIDGLWLVYGRKFGSGDDVENDVLWAYTYWNDNEPNKARPNPNVYCWASYYFMYEGNYDKPDAHTFIHETGHMMGLDDYYDYDGINSPCGKLDMMDENIGDHNAYSKYLYGWISPLYIKEKKTVTIKPFATTGEAIVVPFYTNKKETPFEEYLIIEYYTPTGLNEADAKQTYRPNGYRMFTESGIKIYHVDSRLGKNTDGNKKGYESNLTLDYIEKHSNGSTYYDIMANNTGSYSYRSKDKLLHLLSPNKSIFHDEYYSSRPANNHDLFKKGDKLTNFKGHEVNLPFNIHIDEITSEGATLSFN